MKNCFMHRITIVPTFRCNLRCKLCGLCTPYYENPYHPEADYFCRCVDRFFEIVQSVGAVIISGGEPLVRKDLHKLIDHVFLYEDRFDKIEIITNGTIVPSDALIESAGRFGSRLRVLIDNYGPEISVKLNQVVEKFNSLDQATIDCRDYYTENKYCNGWVDYGISPEAQNRGFDYAKSVYNKCATVNKLDLCAFMAHGKLYSCSAIVPAVEYAHLQANADEVIGLFDDNYTDDERREIISSWYQREQPFSICAYCNGMCEDSERFQPAEQLP